MNAMMNDDSEPTSNSRQIELLKKNFPQCFDKRGAFIPEKLHAIVNDSGTAFSRESYSLNWLGKSYARLLANENTRTLLSEDKVHNAKPENNNSENLLIKGDNLEVLKHLVHAYTEKVKMIYIDPPYNTGSDGFVYQDDRKFTPQKLSRLAGIDEDEAIRILDFTQSKANSHSAWLTFMYPRLYVARELLKDDGVIFISIDDNEVAQLKMLCDEVFGEANLFGTFIWQRRQRADSRNQTNVSFDHEYVIAYQKSSTAKLIGCEIDINKYKNPDNDHRGDWASIDLSGLATKEQRPNLHYDLIDPSTGNVFAPNPNRGWSKSKPVAEKMINEGRVLFPRSPKGRPREKKFLADLRTTTTGFSTCLSSLDVGFTTNGTRELTALFDGKYFDFPKPSMLLSQLIKQASLSKMDIIFDFFAGSGTTAHAVMQLNAEDGGNRRCISVQLDEQTDKKSEARKAGYQSIFDICKARIEKAAAKIKIELPMFGGDLDFKIFETKPIPESYLQDVERLRQGQIAIALVATEDLDDLLTTWQVYDGIALTANLDAVDLAGYISYRYEKTIYLMHTGFNKYALEAILQGLDDTESETALDIEKLVVFGLNFDSKTQREISEALRQYQNKKEKSVSVEFRY